MVGGFCCTDESCVYCYGTGIQERRERHKGWLYEDELPADYDYDYDYDANFHRSEVRDGV